MTDPERTAERDAALDALVALAPFPGWTLAGLQLAAGPNADLLFPGGAADMLESWCDLTDRRMAPQTEGRVPDRVRVAIGQRLASIRPAKEAVRRGLALLAGRPATSARITARTVDAIWYAVGDRSADWSWYTKRAILAAVYAPTLLYWLHDDSDDDAGTLDFLERRLAGVAKLGRLRRKPAAATALHRNRARPAALNAQLWRLSGVECRCARFFSGWPEFQYQS